MRVGPEPDMAVMAVDTRRPRQTTTRAAQNHSHHDVGHDQHHGQPNRGTEHRDRAMLQHDRQAIRQQQSKVATDRDAAAASLRKLRADESSGNTAQLQTDRVNLNNVVHTLNSDRRTLTRDERNWGRDRRELAHDERHLQYDRRGFRGDEYRARRPATVGTSAALGSSGPARRARRPKGQRARATSLADPRRQSAMVRPSALAARLATSCRSLRRATIEQRASDALAAGYRRGLPRTPLVFSGALLVVRAESLPSDARRKTRGTPWGFVFRRGQAI